MTFCADYWHNEKPTFELFEKQESIAATRLTVPLIPTVLCWSIRHLWHNWQFYTGSRTSRSFLLPYWTGTSTKQSWDSRVDRSWQAPDGLNSPGNRMQCRKFAGGKDCRSLLWWRSESAWLYYIFRGPCYPPARIGLELDGNNKGDTKKFRSWLSLGLRVQDDQ